VFARNGSEVILLDQDPQGEEVAAEIRIAGGNATFFRCDVSNESSVRSVIASAGLSNAPLLGLWSNAGVAHFEPVDAMDLNTWTHVLSVNLTGAFLITRALLPLLETGASILYTGSISSFHGASGFSAYCASKGGLLLFARSLAIELAPRGIRVNVIAPGAVDTPMQRADMESRGVPYEQAVAAELAAHPLGRYATPAEVAASAYFLMSDQSSFTTGATLSIDGGFGA
jgi:NAD(P)-dependent dehydrogenase (short-subunit alcohol dehydrogenase family)